MARNTIEAPPVSERGTPSEDPGLSTPSADVVVAGSLASDLSCDYCPTEGRSGLITPEPHTSNPATISQGLGGVGRNIATAVHYAGVSVQLCSLVGDDQAGSTVGGMLSATGLSMSGIHVKPSARTAKYVAVNDAHRDLVLAMADMSIMDECKSEADFLWKSTFDATKARWVVLDANWHPSTLRRWIMHARAANARIAFEPVSVEKSRRLFTSDPAPSFDLGVLPNHAVSLASPNSLELASMHEAAQGAGFFEREDWWEVVDAMGLSSSGSRDMLALMTSTSLVDRGIPQQSIQLLPFIPTVLTKLGEQGVLMTQMLKPGDERLRCPTHSRYILFHADQAHPTLGGVYMRLLPPTEKVPASEIISVNGAGDTFLGIVIAGLARNKPQALVDLIHIAQQGSRMTLRSEEAVSPEIKSLGSLL